MKKIMVLLIALALAGPASAQTANQKQLDAICLRASEYATTMDADMSNGLETLANPSPSNLEFSKQQRPIMLSLVIGAVDTRNAVCTAKTMTAARAAFQKGWAQSVKLVQEMQDNTRAQQAAIYRKQAAQAVSR